MEVVKQLLEALLKIRDSTFRDAAHLRMIADDAINVYKNTACETLLLEHEDEQVISSSDTNRGINN